jgi:hypothetical protein
MRKLNSVQNLLFCRILSNDIKIKIYRSNSPVVSYGYEIWSLALRKEHRVKVLENSVVRRIYVEFRGIK